MQFSNWLRDRSLPLRALLQPQHRPELPLIARQLHLSLRIDPVTCSERRQKPQTPLQKRPRCHPRMTAMEPLRCRPKRAAKTVHKRSPQQGAFLAARGVQLLSRICKIVFLLKTLKAQRLETSWGDGQCCWSRTARREGRKADRDGAPATDQDSREGACVRGARKPDRAPWPDPPLRSSWRDVGRDDPEKAECPRRGCLAR